MIDTFRLASRDEAPGEHFLQKFYGQFVNGERIWTVHGGRLPDMVRVEKSSATRVSIVHRLLADCFVTLKSFKQRN